MHNATLPHPAAIPVVATRNDRQAVLERCVERVRNTSRIFGLRNPQIGNAQKGWEYCKPFDWVISFYAGQLWLAYQFSGDQGLANLARARQADLNLLLSNLAAQDHDLGFIFSLNCVADWKLTGSQTARQMALRAAEALRARFRPAGGYIQAWNPHGTTDTARSTFVAGRIIADTMQNLALLYWAHRETGAPDFKTIADAHADATRRHLIREDGTSFHTFVFDPTTGAPLRGETHQGYSHDSCWSRGQAWGIYGFLLSYIYTGDETMIALSKRLANYFLNRLPEDYVCHWDLALVGTDALRDSSSAAIAVCGLLELVKHLPVTDPDRERYLEWAKGIMSSLTKHYLMGKDEKGNGLLKHSVYHLASNKGVDECASWGDYFYVEALVRFTQSWKLYW